jgi:BirA family biotin operon repressor/biotin-[acetyl-CoA-carboxylase] ligase
MAQHGTAVFAHEQTRGRGQRSKQWITGKNENIALSLIIEPEALSLFQMFALSTAVALGARNFFNRYVKDEVSIKWPNDLYWRDRKAGGILIENILSGTTWKYAIAGIGININAAGFGDLSSRAVSLRQITGNTFDTLTLAHELCAEIDQMIQQLDNPGSLLLQFNSHLYKRGETVRFKKGSRVFAATVKQVNAVGQLVVQHGLEETFDVGEAEWLFD